MLGYPGISWNIQWKIASGYPGISRHIWGSLQSSRELCRSPRSSEIQSISWFQSSLELYRALGISSEALRFKVSKKFQRSFEKVSKKFRKSFEKVSKKFRKSFEKVSKKFRNGFEMVSKWF